MSVTIVRGFRDKIEKYADPRQEIAIEMNTAGPDVYDCSCFGVDASGRLSDERYMVFYNQPESPGREICWSSSGNSSVFRLRLNQIPPSIQKLVFTVSIDGTGTMGNISSHSLTIRQGQQTAASLTMSGKDFHAEKAIISIELYRKDVWRFSAVCSGFNGGLGDLLRSFGGEEASTEPAPQPAPPPPAPRAASSRSAGPVTTPAPASPPNTVPTQPAPAGRKRGVSLEKKLEKGAPRLVSLAKPIQVQLEKHKLQDTVARVALVLDISGSMTGRYQNGTVQEIVNKTLPLAVQFDDDGQLDFWYYGSRCRRMPPVTMKNYTSAVPSDWNSLMKQLGYGNYEPAVMEEVIEEYRESRVPAYILFITDGGVGSTKEIKRLIKDASKLPIFWQFVGVGGFGYGVLKQLDTLRGRYVDNANFFALDDFKKVDNSDLYSRLLNEFPKWLDAIKAKPGSVGFRNSLDVRCTV